VVTRTSFSSRFATESEAVYARRSVSLRRLEMAFETSLANFSVTLQPDRSVVLLRSPLQPGASWEGSWSGDVPGSYSVEVLGETTSRTPAGSFRSIRVRTVLTWQGEHQGTLDVISWIDPRSRVLLESSGRVIAATGVQNQNYEASFTTLLVSGPGY